MIFRTALFVFNEPILVSVVCLSVSHFASLVEQCNYSGTCIIRKPQGPVLYVLIEVSWFPMFVWVIWKDLGPRNSVRNFSSRFHCACYNSRFHCTCTCMCVCVCVRVCVWLKAWQIWHRVHIITSIVLWIVIVGSQHGATCISRLQAICTIVTDRVTVL